MEIDFLGLNSRKHCHEEGFKNVFIERGNEGVETSLSLSSTSSLDSHKDLLNFSERKKTWGFPSSSGSTACGLAEQPGLILLATPAFHHSAAAGYLYDLNNAASTNLRNMPEIQNQLPNSLSMLYSGCPTPNVFSDPDKEEKTMYAAGNLSTRPTGGHTPTVAMARRATLARFLEKRLHRMNQGRTSPLMGKSLSATNSEACETTIAKSNKKRNNHLKRK